MTDVHLEGEDEQTDIDASTQRKRPDAWAVSWTKKCLLILEFTRPNDRCALTLQNTDTYKTEWYTPLGNRLTECLPGREVGIQTFTVGIRGSYDPDRLYDNLTHFRLTAVQTASFMRELVSQTLTELTELYSVRYAALQQHHSAPNG
jgi:hypothetical protein